MNDNSGKVKMIYELAPQNSLYFVTILIKYLQIAI